MKSAAALVIVVALEACGVTTADDVGTQPPASGTAAVEPTATTDPGTDKGDAVNRSIDTAALAPTHATQASLADSGAAAEVTAADLRACRDVNDAGGAFFAATETWVREDPPGLITIYVAPRDVRAAADATAGVLDALVADSVDLTRLLIASEATIDTVWDGEADIDEMGDELFGRAVADGVDTVFAALAPIGRWCDDAGVAMTFETTPLLTAGR